MMSLQMAVEAPRNVNNADELEWDEEADLVVIGFGGAGVAAALEGIEQGAQVIAVDRFDGGGATAFSGGIIYAGDTEHQRQAGYPDSAEEMQRYLQLEGVPVRAATLRRFCAESAANLTWAGSHGVPFGSELYSGKATYPPEGKFLYWGLPILLNIALGGTRRSGNLRGLARKCGIGADALRATVDAYRQALTEGRTDPLGKLPANTVAMDAGPYYAIDVSTHNRFGATSAFTLGGLRVDEDSGSVLRADGSSIAGLHAAGRCAVGLCSNAYMSGLSLADTLFSGRRAARSALRGSPPG